MKIVKDAPVFTRGPTRGEVRYSPFVYLPSDSEDGDLASDGDEYMALKDNLQAYHDQFKVYPRQEDVGQYPRFIPYNSERRIFADATGRDFFEGMLPTFPSYCDVCPLNAEYIREKCFDGSIMGCWMYGAPGAAEEGAEMAGLTLDCSHDSKLLPLNCSRLTQQVLILSPIPQNREP